MHDTSRLPCNNLFPLISPAGAALPIHAATQIGREAANAKVHVKKHLSPILVWMQVVQKGREKKNKRRRGYERTQHILFWV